VLLRAAAVPNDRMQVFPIRQRNLNGDPLAHLPKSPHPATPDNVNRDSSVRCYPLGSRCKSTRFARAAAHTINAVDTELVVPTFKINTSRKGRVGTRSPPVAAALNDDLLFPRIISPSVRYLTLAISP
jgi:hypothetical protein